MSLFTDDEVEGILHDTGDASVWVEGDPAHVTTAQDSSVGREVLTEGGSSVVGTDRILTVALAALPALDPDAWEGTYLQVDGERWRVLDVRQFGDGLEADVKIQRARG